jgi:hypothetical protein
MRINKRLAIVLAAVVLLVTMALVARFLSSSNHNRVRTVSITKASVEKASTSLGVDLGVKFGNTPPADLVYVKQNSAVNFSSQTLIAAANKAGGGCAPDESPLGSFLKVEKSSLLADGSPGSNPMNTASGLQQQVQTGGAKEFSSFYIVYIPPQAVCSTTNDEVVNSQQTSQTQEVYNLFKSVQD